MDQRGQVLADAVMQFARETAALVFLHAPDRAREARKVLLIGAQTIEKLVMPVHKLGEAQVQRFDAFRSRLRFDWIQPLLHAWPPCAS